MSLRHYAPSMADKNPDYSFMKTGFDIRNMQNNTEELRKDIASMVVSFSEYALRTAGIYVTHGQRRTVTREDIRRALMLEVFLFLNRGDLAQKISNVRAELFQDDESDSDDESEPSDEILDASGNPPATDASEQPFVENSCSCALCSAINNIHVKWDGWTPSSGLEKLLKKYCDAI